MNFKIPLRTILGKSGINGSILHVFFFLWLKRNEMNSNFMNYQQNV